MLLLLPLLLLRPLLLLLPLGTTIVFCDRRAKSPPQNSPALEGRPKAPLSRKGAKALLSLRYREGALSLRYRERPPCSEGCLSFCLFISLLAFESHVVPVRGGLATAFGFGHLSTTLSPFAMALVFRKAGTATEKARAIALATPLEPRCCRACACVTSILKTSQFHFSSESSRGINQNKCA